MPFDLNYAHPMTNERDITILLIEGARNGKEKPLFFVELVIGPNNLKLECQGQLFALLVRYYASLKIER